MITISIIVAKVYYRTTRPTPADSELLVWYRAEYAAELGIKPGHKLTVNTINK